MDVVVIILIISPKDEIIFCQLTPIPTRAPFLTFSKMIFSLCKFIIFGSC